MFKKSLKNTFSSKPLRDLNIVLHVQHLRERFYLEFGAIQTGYTMFTKLHSCSHYFEVHRPCKQSNTHPELTCILYLRPGHYHSISINWPWAWLLQNHYIMGKNCVHLYIKTRSGLCAREAGNHGDGDVVFGANFVLFNCNTTFSWKVTPWGGGGGGGSLYIDWHSNWKRMPDPRLLNKMLKSGHDGRIVSTSDCKPWDRGFESSISQLAHQKPSHVGYGWYQWCLSSLSHKLVHGLPVVAWSL